MLTAVQAVAKDGAERAIIPVPAAPVTLAEVESSEKVAADWVTVKVNPAIVKVPVRGTEVFAATEYVTDLLPVPDLPFVILIHPALLTAVQGAVGTLAFNVKLPVPPAALTLALEGFKENVTTEAACVIETVIPATVRVPARTAAFG